MLFYPRAPHDSRLRSRPQLGGGSLRRHRQDHRPGGPHRRSHRRRHAGGNHRRRHLHARRRRQHEAARPSRAGAAPRARTRPRRPGAPGRSRAQPGPRLHRHHPRLLRATAAPPAGGSGRRSGLPGTRPARRPARLRRRLPALDRAAPGLALSRPRPRPRAPLLARGARRRRAARRTAQSRLVPGRMARFRRALGQARLRPRRPPGGPHQQAEATRLRNRCARRGPPLRGLPPLAEFLDRVQRARDAGLFDGNVIENELLRLPQRNALVKPATASTATAYARSRAAPPGRSCKPPSKNSARHADADLAAHLRDELWEVVGLYQQRKRLAGQLDFMDLLLYARDLLRHDGARAQTAAAIYQRIFVDEFQDTDPLQAEILLLLAAADPAERDWRKAAARARQTLRGGRPEAIHLSLPPRRRAPLPPHLPRPARRRRRRSLQLHQQHAQHPRHPGLRQRRVRQQHSPITCRSRAASKTRRDQPGVVALPMPDPYGTRNLSNVQDRRVLAQRRGGLHSVALPGERLDRCATASTGARVAVQPGARLHPLPPLHQFRHRPDAGIRALPGSARHPAPAGGVEIVPSARRGGHAAHRPARHRMARR